MDETLESINRRLKENQWRITRCDPSPAYYVVRSPIQAGHGIEATEWMKGPNGLEPSVPLQIPVPEGLSPITETEDGFVLHYRDARLYGGLIPVQGAARYRYGFADDPA